MSARRPHEGSPREESRRERRRRHSPPSPPAERRRRQRSRSPQSSRHREREELREDRTKAPVPHRRRRRWEEEEEAGAGGGAAAAAAATTGGHTGEEEEEERAARPRRGREREEVEAHRERRRRREGDRERGSRNARWVSEEDAPQREFGGTGGGEEEDDEAAAKIEEPDFGLSGKLTAETNTFRGQVINYSEPEEARVPKTRWRFYPFKGDEVLPTLYLHRQSAFLIGRDKRVCDMIIEHPSCSKQHAVLQYRLVEYTRDDGTMGRRVRPYLIDLDSTNGCYINNQRIESARYYELKEKDMVKFGFSTREYVLLNERSKDDESDEEETAGKTD